MKVFIGLIDVASQVSDLGKGFKKLGIEVSTAIIEPNHLATNSVDTVLDSETFVSKLPIPSFRLRSFVLYHSKRQKLLQQMASECDVFIFIWSSFRSNFSDLAYLKSLGKKIVVFFMGSDLRWYHSYNQEMSEYGIPSYFKNYNKNDFLFSHRALKYKLRYLRTVEKYADVIYSQPNLSQLFLRPYQHFSIPIDLELIEERTTQRKKPIITHAPSNRGVKGTEIVFQTLERLKQEGVAFETQLIENKPHLEALKTFTESDIVIDQLFIPSGGKLAREVLAAGKISMTSLRKEYLDRIPEDCPIIDINQENLYGELKEIILNYPRRVELAKKGRAFVKKHHGIEVICKDIISKLDDSSKNQPSYDYFPKFFRNNLIAENQKQTKLFNKWTKFVSNTAWYKKYVTNGNREGLYF